MKNDLHVLSCGNSSVGGFKWFFVGINQNEMAAVTIDQCYSDDDPRAWIVRSYSPGQDQEEWKLIAGKLLQQIIEACRTQKCNRRIDWNNKQAIRDMYWEFKK